MFCFGILRIFGENSQKSKNWKYEHREPTPRRRPTLRCGMPHRESNCVIKKKFILACSPAGLNCVIKKMFLYRLAAKRNRASDSEILYTENIC